MPKFLHIVIIDTGDNGSCGSCRFLASGFTSTASPKFIHVFPKCALFDEHLLSSIGPTKRCRPCIDAQNESQKKEATTELQRAVP